MTLAAGASLGRAAAAVIVATSAGVALTGCGQLGQSASPVEQGATSTVDAPGGSQPSVPEQPSQSSEPTETREAGHPTFENGTAVTETREAGHPTFTNGVPVSDGDTPCSASVLGGQFTVYRDPDGTPQVSQQGTEHGSITLTNRGSTPCWMSGYANLQVHGDGALVGMNQSYGLDPKPSRVTLQPGEYAAVYFSWYNVSAMGPCKPIDQIDVSLPNAPEHPEEASDLQPVAASPGDESSFICGGQVNSSAVYKP